MTTRVSPAAYSLVEPSTIQSSPYTHENGYISLGERARPVSVEERKRLWWRNAVINILFIGAWSVLLLDTRVQLIFIRL